MTKVTIVQRPPALKDFTPFAKVEIGAFFICPDESESSLWIKTAPDYAIDLSDGCAGAYTGCESTILVNTVSITYEPSRL